MNCTNHGRQRCNSFEAKQQGAPIQPSAADKTRQDRGWNTANKHAHAFCNKNLDRITSERQRFWVHGSLYTLAWNVEQCTLKILSAVLLWSASVKQQGSSVDSVSDRRGSTRSDIESSRRPLQKKKQPCRQSRALIIDSKDNWLLSRTAEHWATAPDCSKTGCCSRSLRSRRVVMDLGNMGAWRLSGLDTNSAWNVR
jgi:hypothetical protein